MRVVYEPPAERRPQPPQYALAAMYRPGTIVEHDGALWRVIVDERDHDHCWARHEGPVPGREAVECS